MKRPVILLIALLIIMTFASLPALPQSGPGGVGDMTNTQLWLRADRGLFTIMPFSAVVQWDDQSGNARNFKPVLIDQNVPERTSNAVNGLPALTFDDMGGINGAFLGYRGGLGFSGSGAATVIIVAKNTSANDEQNGGLYTGQENVGAAGQVRNYSIGYSDAVGFNGQNQVFNDGHTAGNWKMAIYSNAAGSSVSGYRAWLDGTTLTGNSASSTVPLLTGNFCLLGATQYGGTFNSAGFFDGEMAEVVVYSSQLNDASRLVLENSLGAKYNLTIANDHYAYQATHSHDVSGIAAYNSTTFTNGHSSELLSINSPSDLSENEFLFYGHDNQDATVWTMTEVPASGTYRIAREWRVDETSEVGTVTLSIPAASLPAIPAGYDNVAILTDADGDFTSGAVMHRATLTAGIYNLSLNLSAGQFITIIAFRPEIYYSVISGSGPEGVTPVNIQATLNYIHTADITVDYAVTGGTATEGVDFTLAPGALTIPAGSLTGSFNLNIVSDAILEPDETVTAGLLNPTPGVAVGSQNTYTYTIINDDFIYASFSTATAAEAEGSTAHAVLMPQLVLSGGIMTVPGSLVLTVTNGTATADDWSQAASLIAIPAGDYTTPVSVSLPLSALSILGDLTVENDETVNLALNTFNVVRGGAILSCVYTIVNDDNATIGVTTATPLIPEGGPGATGSGTFTFSLTNPSAVARTVSYSVTGTAISGTDFTALTGSFVMPANTLTFSVNLTTVADIIVEGDETVRVTVTGITGTPAIAVDATPATITISDDDLPSVLYAPSSITMAEGGTSTFEVWLANPPAGNVTLNLSTLKVGELAVGPVILTFNGATYATHQVVTVQSVEDNVMGDNTDNIIVTVNDALSDDPFDPLPDINIPVTIINNDLASLVVNPGSVNVAENGTVTFTVALSAGPAAGDVVINLVSNDLTIATIDKAVLTFTTINWNVPQTVTVSGVNNNTVPNIATTISLTVNNALSDNSYDGLTATVNVNVTNDDIAGFIVNPLTLTLNEGGPAGQFTVVLSAQPQTNVVFDLVNLAPVNVTHPAQITFTPADWNVPVLVSVLPVEDALDTDRTDIIAVTVNQGLTDNNFDAMAAQNVNINIKDNDPPVITGCPANITANSAPGLCNAMVSWIAPVASSPMVSTHNPGATFPVGVTTVTYTSTDNDGMISTCVFTVTVTDILPPEVTCKPATVYLDAAGNGSVVVGDLIAVPVTDNCSVSSVTLSRSTFTCADLGTVSVTVTATDGSGNVSTCTSAVTVTDAFNASVSAGPDAGICITDPSFTISGATALNATVLWTTSGTGTFSNPATVNPVYTPGAGDAPAVTLTVTGTKLSGCPQPVTDAMTLTIAGLPSADAGADKNLCSGTTEVPLTGTSATNGSVLWTTSGNGTFSDPASVSPVYTFGSSDTGPVTLTMTVSNGYCTDASDDLTVTFIPGPTADAGPDAGLCRTETGYQVAGASYAGGTLLWKSSGNGTFSDPATDNPYYTFGTSDYLSGSATLTMEVTGTGQCSTAKSSAVITIHPLPAITAGISNVTCPGMNDAEVHLSVASGVAPLTYSIEGSPFQASGDFTGLTPGDWYFEVMDGNGCVSDTTVTVTEPLPFTAAFDNVTHVKCNGGNNGSVNISAAGGTQPYSISWTGPSGFTAATEDISGLTAGVYDLAITDLYACASYIFSITVTEPPAITVTGVTLSDRNGFGVTCPTGNDGFINITAGGGISTLEIEWSGPGGFSSTSEDISGLEPGTYTLTITDGAGCTFTGDYLLTAPEPMTVTPVTGTGSCPDVADGSIDITVTGGTGTLTYSWEDGITLPDRPAILPGEHTVTVTDANGCMIEYPVTVEMTGYNCLRVYEIITPNGDGKNDTWKMRNADLYPDAEVFVYSRWGKLVFNTRNAAGDEWDGTYKGKLLPNDSYHYVIYLNDGSEPRTGVISIISK